MASVHDYPHVDDLSDGELIAIVRECDDWGEFADCVRGGRSAIRKRLKELGVDDELATGTDLLRAAGIDPITGQRIG